MAFRILHSVVSKLKRNQSCSFYLKVHRDRCLGVNRADLPLARAPDADLALPNARRLLLQGRDRPDRTADFHFFGRQNLHRARRTRSAAERNVQALAEDERRKLSKSYSMCSDQKSFFDERGHAFDRRNDCGEDGYWGPVHMQSPNAPQRSEERRVHFVGPTLPLTYQPADLGKVTSFNGRNPTFQRYASHLKPCSCGHIRLTSMLALKAILRFPCSSLWSMRCSDFLKISFVNSSAITISPPVLSTAFFASASPT